jgi:hypothetical protein
MSRREWLLLFAAAVLLQGFGLWRAVLPAQDGLKFLRVARDFQNRPFAAAVRGSDQHPLYPLCVAAVEPLARQVLGRSPTAWRVAAQCVSAMAWVAMLVPIHGLSRSLFNRPTAKLACLLQLALPASAEFGHETLADPLALCLTLTTLWLGLNAARRKSGWMSILCGVVAGGGYWTRPETAIAPIAFMVWGLWKIGTNWFGESGSRKVVPFTPGRTADFRRLGTIGLGFFVLVGTYATVKGELSEKLALRRSVAIASIHDAHHASSNAVPVEIGRAGRNFAPKEEAASAPWGFSKAAAGVARGWFAGLGWTFAILAIWGMVRVRARSSKRLIQLYALLFSAIAIRHAMTLGYLSDRHLLSLGLLSLPWAAAGLRKIGGRIAELTATPRRWASVATVLAVLGSATILQARPAHPTRTGHLDAGRWLIEHAAPGEAVLDTRGWANFIAGRGEYDYWHVGQAFSDRRLRYLVVGRDELTADSPRAATLRSIIHDFGANVHEFPDQTRREGAAVLVVRLRLPGAGKESGR